MSLILRQKCQPMLDALKLSKLHVGLTGNVMCLQGECGQTLININGIKFATKNPKTGEIDYAVELFEAFMVKHSKAIQDFITLSEKAKTESGKAPTLPSGVYNTTYAMQRNGGSAYVSIRGVPKGKTGMQSQMVIYSTGTFQMQNISESLEDISDMYNQHMPIVMEYFGKATEYRESQDALNKARGELAKCDI